MRVFATGGSAAGRAELEAHGAEQVLDHTKEGYLEPLREWTRGHGVDLIVEMLANVNLPNDLSHVARGGCIVIVGARGNVEVSPRTIMQRECDVRGLMLFNATPAEIREAIAAIQGGLESGALTPVVGADFPLAEASAAHDAVMAPGHRGKVVVSCRAT
jgi:NADPH2:quinone reductase